MLMAIRVAACLLPVPPLVAAASLLAHAGPQVAREAAHPVVSGAAGPYAQVEVVLTRPGEVSASTFSGFVRVGRQSIILHGNPDEPEGFFRLEPQAILFTPIDRTRRNGIVVLYRSSRIGPGHGTDHRALVYRLERRRAVRIPALEQRLEGARDAATARRRLRAGGTR